MGIEECFALVLGEELDMSKGLIHHQKFKEHAQDPDFEAKCLYVGDGKRDMQLAQSYGVIPVGITQNISAQELREAGASYTIDRLQELPLLLHQLEHS